jgi:hypothetical protein
MTVKVEGKWGIKWIEIFFQNLLTGDRMTVAFHSIKRYMKQKNRELKKLQNQYTQSQESPNALSL